MQKPINIILFVLGLCVLIIVLFALYVGGVIPSKGAPGAFPPPPKGVPNPPMTKEAALAKMSFVTKDSKKVCSYIIKNGSRSPTTCTFPEITMFGETKTIASKAYGGQTPAMVFGNVRDLYAYNCQIAYVYNRLHKIEGDVSKLNIHDLDLYNGPEKAAVAVIDAKKTHVTWYDVATGDVCGHVELDYNSIKKKLEALLKSYFANPDNSKGWVKIPTVNNFWGMETVQYMGHTENTTNESAHGVPIWLKHYVNGICSTIIKDMTPKKWFNVKSKTYENKNPWN